MLDWNYAPRDRLSSNPRRLRARGESGAYEASVAQMGWEKRGAHQYYYRKEREGSRVKSVYVGRGEIANMVSDLQSTSGLFERALSIAYPPQTEQLKDQDGKLEQACRLVDSITQASLLAAGFHMHRRQWRKKRYGPSAKESENTNG